MVSDILELMKERKYKYIMRMKSAKKMNNPQRQHDQKMKAEAIAEMITVITAKGAW